MTNISLATHITCMVIDKTPEIQEFITTFEKKYKLYSFFSRSSLKTLLEDIYKDDNSAVLEVLLSITIAVMLRLEEEEIDNRKLCKKIQEVYTDIYPVENEITNTKVLIPKVYRELLATNEEIETLLTHNKSLLVLFLYLMSGYKKL